MNFAIDKNVPAPASLIPPKHLNDAGVDIKWGYDFDVRPGDIVKIDTGISLDIPIGWMGLIVPRSSNNRLCLANEEGIIDSSYVGNIILKVSSKYTGGVINIFEEDRDFQLIIVPHMIHYLEEVDKIDKNSTRGSGGFGSTN